MGINQLFRDPGSFLYAMLLTLPGIIIGLTFHEYAHAYVSYKLGDPTPKNQGHQGRALVWLAGQRPHHLPVRHAGWQAACLKVFARHLNSFRSPYDSIFP